MTYWHIDSIEAQYQGKGAEMEKMNTQYQRLRTGYLCACGTLHQSERAAQRCRKATREADKTYRYQSALRHIAEHPHCTDDPVGDYGTGVQAGHRCAASIAQRSIDPG